ncbi:MAG: ATP-grasp domain-containing protein [Clostridiales bacterium]|nr:ATP-grasp domain-containing protein [Clostridiales bacterium]
MTGSVLVTAIGSFSAEAVIRGCKEMGFRVVGCDIYPAKWVANSRDVDVCYLSPPGSDGAAYRSFLAEVCEKEGIGWILPLTDVEVDAIQAWRLLDPQMGGLRAVVCMSGTETIDYCRNKEKIETFLSERKLCRTIPGRWLTRVFLSEASSGYGDMTFPQVIKPVDGRSSQGLHIVQDPAQMAYWSTALRRTSSRYLVQPKIEGDVITVDVVRDPQSGDCVCLPRRELLRTSNGAGTSVYVFRDEALERECQDMAAALDICGCVNFEFIESKETGGREYYFLECNPRFAGGVAFSRVAGYDMVKNHLNVFLGNGIEPVGRIREMHVSRRYEEYGMEDGQT